MPMPALDPLRYVPVMPVDPSHKVPRADGLRSFSRDPANPDVADLFDPYEAQLLAGGSLRRACEVETADARAAAAKAAADREEAAAKAAAGREEAARAAADAAGAVKAEADREAAARRVPADAPKADPAKAEAPKP